MKVEKQYETEGPSSTHLVSKVRQADGLYLWKQKFDSCICLFLGNITDNLSEILNSFILAQKYFEIKSVSLLSFASLLAHTT